MQTTTEPARGQTSSGRGRVLVVDDERRARQTMSVLLEDEGFETRTAANGFRALGILEDWRCDAVLTDLRMPMMDGFELIDRLHKRQPDIPCIAVTAFDSVESAVEAMKSGAEDYLTKPLDFEAVQLAVERAVDRARDRRELERLRRETGSSDETDFVGDSPAMQRLKDTIAQVADSNATVLITGESGTGKELVARRLHEQSDRADQPFVQLHCSALNQSLLESELFGHEKGAFTGADQQREGRFEYADGGTLFLDEIGEIAEATQVKLLRFLQHQEFERVGGNETLRVDVRVVAATNKDLESEVRDGHFREDLFYRLRVVDLHVPPLRTRREDIPALARYFVSEFARENDKEIDEIDPEIFERFEEHDWPGNVRELENVIERAVVLCPGGRLEPHHLPDEFADPELATGLEVEVPGSTLEDVEKYVLLKTYEATGGVKTRTADILGISTRKVQYKLKEYREEGIEIDPSDHPRGD